MSRNFHETLHDDDDGAPALPSDRSTALVFAAVAAVVALFWRANGMVVVVALGVAAMFALTGFAAPRLIHPLNVAWMRFAVILGRVVNPLVMLILFAVLIVPFGLVMQLRYDPLRRRRPSADSYWQRCDNRTNASMRNQF